MPDPPIHHLGYASDAPRRASGLRIGIGLGVVVATGFACGYALCFAGFGTLPLLFMLWISGPLICGSLMPGRPVVAAMMFNVLVEAFPLVWHNCRTWSLYPGKEWELLQEFGGMLIIGLGLAQLARVTAGRKSLREIMDYLSG